MAEGAGRGIGPARCTACLVRRLWSARQRDAGKVFGTTTTTPSAAATTSAAAGTSAGAGPARGQHGRDAVGGGRCHGCLAGAAVRRGAVAGGDVGGTGGGGGGAGRRGGRPPASTRTPPPHQRSEHTPGRRRGPTRAVAVAVAPVTTTASPWPAAAYATATPPTPRSSAASASRKHSRPSAAAAPTDPPSTPADTFVIVPAGRAAPAARQRGRRLPPRPPRQRQRLPT